MLLFALRAVLYSAYPFLCGRLWPRTFTSADLRCGERFLLRAS